MSESIMTSIEKAVEYFMLKFNVPPNRILVSEQAHTALGKEFEEQMGKKLEIKADAGSEYFCGMKIEECLADGFKVVLVDE